MENKQTDITKISAIIAAHNYPDLTKQCIKILGNTLAEFPHEIIVVDDGSVGGKLQTNEDIKLIRNEKQLGVAASWNQGMKLAAGNILLLIHNSILITGQALSTMMTALLSRPDIGVVGPLTNDCHYSVQQGILVNGTVTNISSIDNLVQQTEEMGLDLEPLFFLEDFCMLMRKEASDAVGEFDERFFPVGFEDADYGLRLRRAGYSLLRVGTYVHNCGGGYLDEGLSWSDTWEKNKTLFHEKWGVIPAYSLMVRLDVLKYIDKDKENLSVLDVGCACGTNLMWLKYHNPGARLQGIELNEKSAAIAKWFAKVEAADVEQLEREDWNESFDYIILADIVEHLRDPWEFLKRMRNFLKQDGRVIVSIPNVCHVSNLWDMLHGDWEYGEAGILDSTHLRFFTKKSFSKCLEQAGLRIQSIEPRKLVGDGHNKFIDGVLSLEDVAVSREELETIQWIFVASWSGGN